MLNIAFPIPETDDTVSRNIAFALIEQVKDITNIQKDAEVTYIGQGGSRKHFQSTTSPDGAPVKLGSDRAVIVEVEEVPSESFFANETVHQPNQLIDFFDKDIGLFVKPVYAGFDFVLTFTYRTPSRAEALRWRNDTRSRHSQLRGVNMHDVPYIYQLTPKVIELIEHLYTLKETQGGDGLTFQEYFNRNISRRAYQHSTVVGSHPTVFFKEVGTRIQGTFDFTADPRKQERSEGLGWEIQFTYTVELSRPISWAVKFPIIVNNQPIDMRWIPQLIDDQYEKKRAMGLVTNALTYMEAPSHNARASNIKPATHYPLFDEWLANQAPPGHRLVSTWLLGLQPKQSVNSPAETVLVNLSSLGDQAIDPDILEWILGVEYRYLHLPFISPVQVHLYRNECIASSESIEVRSNGDVVLKDPIDIRKRYRIALTLAFKIRNCDFDSLRRLAQYPKAMCKILKLTNTNEGEIHDLLSYIDLREFRGCTGTGGTTEAVAIANIVRMKTVMVAGIVADRVEDMDKPLPQDYLLRFNVQ